MTGTRARHLAAGPIPSRAKLLGKSRDQERMIMPRLDELHGKRRAAFDIQRRAIKPHAGARVLRSQADDDGALHAIRLHGGNRVRDKRLPVTHANVHRQLQFFRQQFALPQREFGQRRPANQPVAMLHFLNHFRRDGPAAGDLIQKFRYVVHRIGTAVSQKQNRIFHQRIKTPSNPGVGFSVVAGDSPAKRRHRLDHITGYRFPNIPAQTWPAPLRSPPASPAECHAPD